MKYIDADKLISEIERIGRNWDGVTELQPASLFQSDLCELLLIIDSLQQEQQKVDLEKYEDERIRKYIVKFIEVESGVNLPPEDANRMLAYLTKIGTVEN